MQKRSITVLVSLSLSLLQTLVSSPKCPSVRSGGALGRDAPGEMLQLLHLLRSHLEVVAQPPQVEEEEEEEEDPMAHLRSRMRSSTMSTMVEGDLLAILLPSLPLNMVLRLHTLLESSAMCHT